MWRRNPAPATSMEINPGTSCFATSARKIVRTGDIAVHPCPRNELKSCSPTRCDSPSRTASRSEGLLDVPRVAGEERRIDRGKVQEIPVLLLRRVAPRVERLRNDGSGEDADGGREKGVSAVDDRPEVPHPRRRRSRRPAPGRAPPRRCDPRPAGGPAPAGSGQHLLHHRLDRRPVRLDLPSGVRRPVVRNAKLDASQGRRTRKIPGRSGRGKNRERRNAPAPGVGGSFGATRSPAAVRRPRAADTSARGPRRSARR